MNEEELKQRICKLCNETFTSIKDVNVCDICKPSIAYNLNKNNDNLPSNSKKIESYIVESRG